MKILTDLNMLSDFLGNCNSSVSIGNFDGCHLGHQKLLAKIAKFKNSHSNTKCLAITFDPHPAEVMHPDRRIFRLQRLNDRMASLGEYGVEAVLILKFTKEFASLSPTDFVKNILVDAARAKYIAIGENFKFGKGKAGDTALLSQMGSSSGFEVEVVSPVTCFDKVVSSTSIRYAISEAGDLDLAKKLLTRPWGFWGKVVTGDQRGRLLGFPTANLDLNEVIRPKAGVYAGRMSTKASKGFDKKPMVLNVGSRPTFGPGDVRVEMHILDDTKWDLYGEEVWVEPFQFLRGEQKFENVEALKTQIGIDCKNALRALS